jgi:hypothetical protein|tara:strand:+ start:1840 stop:2163 length:324 start_codon:yes stop_codon:yes gene_type:complete
MLTDKQKEMSLIDFSQYNPTERKNIRLYGKSHKDWTLSECIDHKHSWFARGLDVRITATDTEEMQKWCKDNIYLQSWNVIKRLEGVKNKHQFLFENQNDAFIFKLLF